LTSLKNRTIWFRVPDIPVLIVRERSSKKGNTRKSEVQVCLWHGKGDRSIKEKIQRRLKPQKMEVPNS
jgi:hypothetical protein